MPDLGLEARTYWVPKRGNSEEEYEDAFFPEFPRERKGRVARFAVADGASEGMLSGPWAKILVRAFFRAYQRPSRSSARFLLARACDSWETWKAAYLRRRAEVGRPVQWWEEQGLETGPFSTLLGVAFLLPQGGETGRWDAIAVGDSCLFAVRDNGLAVRFPIRNSSGFGSRPVLISGDPARNAAHLDKIAHSSGALSIGDRFYLMTDALAAWFLNEAEDGREPWDALSSIEGDEGFFRLVHGLRQGGEIRNDDVTLTCIRVVST
jgi:hypothetical protein